jgi:hypothetical protein
MTADGDLWKAHATREVEPHDSTLASVEAAGGVVVIRLAPAYVIASGDEPARNGGSGWSVDVEIALGDAELKTAPIVLPCWISDGFVGLAGAARMHLLSLPSSLTGDLTVYFLTENAEELLVKARSMEVNQRGEPAFVEKIEPEFWR